MDRPLGVTLLALMNWAVSAVCLLAGMGALSAGFLFLITSAGRSGLFGWGSFLLIGGACLALGVFSLKVGIGLWRLRNRSRQMQIALLVLFSVFELFAIFGALMHSAFGVAILRSLFLGIELWILIYLFKPNVKVVFSKASAHTPEAPDSRS